LHKSLTYEASLRYSDIATENGYTGEEQKSSGATHSIKIGYRPINDLLIRATKGTSYRAPNLREVALRAESGFHLFQTHVEFLVLIFKQMNIPSLEHP